jgi:hypothetical protein
VHKKIHSRRRTRAPKKKKQPKTPPKFENTYKTSPKKQALNTYSKPKKKKPKSRQNFRGISTKVFFQRNKRLMSSSTTITTTIHTGH